MRYKTYIGYFLLLALFGCGMDPVPMESPLSDIPYEPQDYELNIPANFPQFPSVVDNPMTVEGVELGRRLFYDPILSIDSSMSCSSCHNQQAGFTDNRAFSEGVDGSLGSRSSMSLIDMAFQTNGLFWDGRSITLEDQALIPVEDPIELHDSWPNVEAKLQRHIMYPILFRKAFGIDEKVEVTRELVVNAIAQFERSIISSGNAKYDRVIQGIDVFTDQELRGHNIFFDIEPDPMRHAECGHCHNAPLFTINDYANNGIDDVDGSTLKDVGRGTVTRLPLDQGKFKIPTLRNIFLTAPYMHDGRFATIDEVIDHYVTGGHPSRNLDPVLRPLTLTLDDREDLKAFIKTLEDPDVLSDPRYSSPF